MTILPVVEEFSAHHQFSSFRIHPAIIGQGGGGIRIQISISHDGDTGKGVHMSGHSLECGQVRLSTSSQPLEGVTLIHVCGQGSTATPRTTILAIREAVQAASRWLVLTD